jgi:hypothetical protein
VNPPPWLLLCSPTTHAPIVTAAERWCHLCGVAVWVSHSMLADVDNATARPACLECGTGVIDSAPHTAVTHPRQIDELRSAGLLDIARQVVSAVNARSYHRHR